MHRSRSKKLNQAASGKPGIGRRVLLQRAPIAVAIMAAIPRVYAADASAAGANADTGQLQEVVVTATKRSENLQNVPISVTALSSQTLEDLHVQNFNDYVKFLPSVGFQSDAGGGGASGPGFTRVFMRGVSSGDNGNHSGPLPTVGIYLDEQPITTIQGALDVHIYDIERVEALAGPQGTLYGASSEAGTVRIITNKPDPSAFKAGYDIQGDVTRGSGGYVAEGFVNVPLSPSAAVRLVGWSEHDAGFINNVAGQFDQPVSGNPCISNTTPPAAGCVGSPVHPSSNFNTVQTNGARGALKIDLNDSWTITPTLMGQSTTVDGPFAYDPAVGNLDTVRFYPDTIDDKWYQAALTVAGKISNWDVTYAGGFVKRVDHTSADYADYTLYYDKVYGSGHYFCTGPTCSTLYNGTQYIVGRDAYEKISHEARLTSPKDKPLRFIGGLFYERQQHDILQDYVIDALPTANSVPGWPQSLWLTDQVRVDRDWAAFGELSYDILPQLTATVGYRFFHYENSLNGFYGFGSNNPYGSSTGEGNWPTGSFPPPSGSPTTNCFAGPSLPNTPCTDVNNTVSGTGSIPKFNLTYHLSDDAMLYATFSKGFRPGGLNRRLQSGNDPTTGLPLPTLATYAPDYLTNYEFGWKTSWFDHHLRYNSALFWEDWKNFQFSFLGANSFTIVRNAGAARIRGWENTLEWAPVAGLQLTAGATVLDPKLTQDFCISTGTNGQPLPLTGTGPNVCPLQNAAPTGTQLPSTPKFKGDLRARYTFALANDLQAHVQAALEYVSTETQELPPAWASLIGNTPAYTLTDLTGGIAKGNFTAELFVNNVFDKEAQFDRYSECPVYSPINGFQGTSTTLGSPLCGARPHVGVATPRTIGIQFGQRF
jgi:iron complex outermembrane receptor protein